MHFPTKKIIYLLIVLLVQSYLASGNLLKTTPLHLSNARLLTEAFNQTTLQISKFMKSGCNSLEVDVLVEPPSPLFENLSSLIEFRHQNLTEYKYIEGNQSLLRFNLSYGNDLRTPTIQMVFQNLVYTFDYDPIIIPAYYSSEQCLNQNVFRQVVLGFQIGAYVALVLGIFINGKIMILQFVTTLQLSYFILAKSSKFTIYLQAFSSNMMNGYSMEVFQETKVLPENLQQMDRYASFINNFNIMYLLTIVILLIGLTLKAISICSDSSLIKDAKNFFLKEFLLTFLMFNCINIGFSVGVHWNYFQHYRSELSGISLFFCISLMLICLICFQATKLKTYGEFKKKLKPGNHYSYHIINSFIFKFMFGLLLSKNTDFEGGVLLMASLYVLNVMVLRPFSKLVYNLFASTMAIEVLIVLGVGYSYQNQEPFTKAHLHSIFLFLIVSLGFCLVFSYIMIVYELVEKCKTRSNRVMEEIQETENSILENRSETNFNKNKKTTLTLITLTDGNQFD